MKRGPARFLPRDSRAVFARVLIMLNGVKSGVATVAFVRESKVVFTHVSRALVFILFTLSGAGMAMARAESGGSVTIASGDANFSSLLATTGSMASGDYTFDFNGAFPVWDVSGSYSGNIGSDFDVDYSVTVESSGKFTGAGTVSRDDGSGNVLTGSATVSGRLTNSGTLTRVALTVQVSGAGTAKFGPIKRAVTFAGTVKLAAEIDAAGGELFLTGGSAGIRLTDKATGIKISQTFAFPAGASFSLPPDVTGDWNLAMNLAPEGNKYSGTATVRSSTGATLDLTAAGSYSPVTGSSKLKLNGGGCSLSLVVLTSGTDLNIQSMKGKLFGQHLNIPAP